MLSLSRYNISLLCIVLFANRITIGSSFLLANHFECIRSSSSTSLKQETTTHACDVENGNASTSLSIPPGILGPPEPLRSLPVGQSVKAFRTLARQDDDDDPTQIDFTISRVSKHPDIFHLQNFVTDSECINIISAAKDTVMNRAETVTKTDTTSRKNCTVAWLKQHGDDYTSNIINNLVSSTANIFLSTHVKSHPSAGVQDLQVLEYKSGGEFVMHVDGEPKILTVIYYINGVGGTWFPLARTEEDTSGVQLPVVNNKRQALDMIKNYGPGKNGLLVQKSSGTKELSDDNNEHIAYIKQGDAIAFYNYKDDGSARLDWNALHCGLPIKDEGTKWIANHWYELRSLKDQ